MERRGGSGVDQSPAERPDPSGVDHLSALPDDPLVHILLRLDTAAAARTSVLSRRWRRVWTLLPELRFDLFFPDPHPVASALVVHKAALRLLQVAARDPAPESVAAWLPTAANRLSGRFSFRIEANEKYRRGAFQLPCFEQATSVILELGLRCLALPSTGVFARLTELCLINVRIYGQCKLGDVVSSPRCPCLQKLTLTEPDILDDVTIRSESLLQINLDGVDYLEQLTVVAPALKELTVMKCRGWSWHSDSSSIHLCEMEHLESLSTSIYPYGINDVPSMLLQHSKAIECLSLVIYYPPDIRGSQYRMDDIIMLPQTTLLSFTVVNKTHAFGASLFHLLKMCTGVRVLQLDLCAPSNLEELLGACPSGCTCDQPDNWKTEELVLDCLQSIVISDMKGTDHEVSFLQRLFSWTTAPTEITFSCCVSKSKAWELRQTLSTFCKPGTSLKCYIFHNPGKETRYMLAPED